MRVEEIGGLKVRMTGGGQGPVVILLHGFGAPGTDLVPLADEIVLPGARFVFPEAPHLLPVEIGGGVGRAWWHIDVMKMQLAIMTGQTRDLTREVPEGLAESRAQIEVMLAELDDGSPRFIGGFSQGAMLATDVVLRSELSFAGLVVMSGTLLAEDDWRPRMPKRAGLPVFQSHGTVDPLLPFAIAETLRDAFNDAGMPVDWVTFPRRARHRSQRAQVAERLSRKGLFGVAPKGRKKRRGKPVKLYDGEEEAPAAPQGPRGSGHGDVGDVLGRLGAERCGPARHVARVRRADRQAARRSV